MAQLPFRVPSIDLSNPLNASNLVNNLGPLLTKASLVNLDTNETYGFLFNPTEVQQAPIKAVYDEKNIAFRSHPKYQYKYTSAKTYLFQLYLSSTSSNAQNVTTILPLSRNLNNDTSYLESLVYPLNATGIANRRPPRVRFVWPNLINQKVLVTSVGVTYRKFNFRLQQQITLVDLELVEIVDRSRTSNEVRQRGANNRPGAIGAVLDILPSSIGDAIDKAASFF